MKLTFTVSSDSDLGKSERRAEKRQRREDAKAMKLERTSNRRTKMATRAFFA